MCDIMSMSLFVSRCVYVSRMYGNISAFYLFYLLKKKTFFSYVRERWGTSCGFDLGRFHSSNSSYLSATLSLNTVFVVFTIYCLVQAYRNSKRGHNEFEPLLNDVELVKVCKKNLIAVNVTISDHLWGFEFTK